MGFPRTGASATGTDPYNSCQHSAETLSTKEQTRSLIVHAIKKHEGDMAPLIPCRQRYGWHKSMSVNKTSHGNLWQGKRTRWTADDRGKKLIL